MQDKILNNPTIELVFLPFWCFMVVCVLFFVANLFTFLFQLAKYWFIDNYTSDLIKVSFWFLVLSFGIGLNFLMAEISVQQYIEDNYNTEKLDWILYPAIYSLTFYIVVIIISHLFVAEGLTVFFRRILFNNDLIILDHQVALLERILQN